MDVGPHYGGVCVLCSLQGHTLNHAMPSLGTEPLINNLAFPNLHSYALSCISSIVEILVLHVFPSNDYYSCDYHSALLLAEHAASVIRYATSI